MTQKTLHLTLKSLADAWTGHKVPQLGAYVPLDKVSAKIFWADECQYLYALAVIAASNQIADVVSC